MGKLALARQLQFGVFGWAGFCITEWLWFDIIAFIDAFHVTITDLNCVAVKDFMQMARFWEVAIN